MFYNKKMTKTRLDTFHISFIYEQSGFNNQSVSGQSFVIKLQQNYQFGKQKYFNVKYSFENVYSNLISKEINVK